MVLIVFDVRESPCQQEFISVTLIGLTTPPICTMMYDVNDFIEEFGNVRFQAVRVVNEIVNANDHEDNRYSTTRYHNVEVAIT